MTSTTDDQSLVPNVQPFPGPAVYMFQPTHYAVVENDQLAEWAEALSQKVGLTTLPAAPGSDTVVGLPRLLGHQTWSCCGSGVIDEFCDCDIM